MALLTCREEPVTASIGQGGVKAGFGSTWNLTGQAIRAEENFWKDWGDLERGREGGAGQHFLE